MVFLCFAFELVLTLGVYYITILYIIYYTYTIILFLLYLILYYTLLQFFFSSFLFSHLPLPILFSPLQSFSSKSISFLFPLPKLILFFPPHLISSPFTILSFKVYVSAFGYPYLYSRLISQISDPACFIGVDG